MFSQEIPPPGLVMRLWIQHAQTPTRLRRSQLDSAVNTIDLVSGSIADMVKQRPAEIVRALSEHKANIETKEGYTSSRPEMTSAYVYIFAVAPLEVLAYKIYHSGKIPEFKFWMDVMSGGTESLITLAYGITSLRGNMQEKFDSAHQRQIDLFGIQHSVERRQELLDEYLSEGRMAEGFLRNDPSGLSLLDYCYERSSQESGRPDSPQPYKHYGTGLARYIYKLVYPLSDLN